MNRWMLTLLAGSVVLAPVGAKTVTKSHKSSKAVKRAPKSMEDAAWGSTGAKKTAKAKPKKATPDHSMALKPTVGLKQNQKPVSTNRPAEIALTPPDHAKLAAHTDESSTPGLPADFGTDSEMKAYQSDLHDNQTQIHQLVTKFLNRKPSQLSGGLSGVIADQPAIEQALGDDRIAQEDRDSLKSLVQQRDSTLYMLSASLLAQKKDTAAAVYLRFLAKNASPESSLQQAALQEMAQLGIRP